MKRIICEMCEGSSFVKEEGFFVCQTCGCKYSVEDARKMMVEVDETNVAPQKPAEQKPAEQKPAEKQEPEFPLHTSQSPNRLFVQITKVTIDSANGVTIGLFIENLSKKDIKYAAIYATPYNAVNDAVYCETRRQSTRGIRVTGPIGFCKIWTGTGEKMWYNSSVKCVRLNHVDVEYMDGSKERFLPSMLEPKGVVTVRGVFCAGGPREAWYTIDGGDKYILHEGEVRTHLLPNGKHMVRVINPFAKGEKEIDTTIQREVCLYMKTFGMDII